MANLENEIKNIIEYYYESESNANRLWEIVCDNLDLDYEDETAGNIFDDILLYQEYLERIQNGEELPEDEQYTFEELQEQIEEYS